MVPHFLGDYLVGQAKTQGLSLIDQLNNGMRFLDMRIMLTEGENDITFKTNFNFKNGDTQYQKEKQTWRGLHMLQTKNTVETYFKQVRGWLDAHPSEVVVMWLTRHGN